MEATPLRKLTLPARLAAAIEEKLGAEQESQRMQFVLQKEKQEAERKRLEAQGIADFQRIVTQGISPELLRWKGIEATVKLAESSNTKVVVVGAGKDGLPLILGGQMRHGRTDQKARPSRKYTLVSPPEFRPRATPRTPVNGRRCPR